MTDYSSILRQLRQNPKRWLITGVAGFIGSNLLETLLQAGQEVWGLDNFSTGYQKNLDQVREAVGPAWRSFHFSHGDIRDLNLCRMLCRNADYVLHEAALGSVPRSIEDPMLANHNNIDGFLNMLIAARDCGVHRFVYAASSAVYGNEPTLPKREDLIMGRPLSPYALTKYVNELYAGVFADVYGLQSVGLRYFNIFGPRQDPAGAYAAVIPNWLASMLKNELVHINGDGENTRDFCYIDNCVQANILAAVTDRLEAVNQIYNVAVGRSTSLNELFEIIRNEAARHNPAARQAKPVYREARQGDVRYSLADIRKAQALLGYAPEYTAAQGLTRAGDWYAQNLGIDCLPGSAGSARNSFQPDSARNADSLVVGLPGF
jgi:UDP-N-acetylglucosamine 4-epimerase